MVSASRNTYGKVGIIFRYPGRQTEDLRSLAGVMLRGHYCACCGKRFYRGGDADDWPYKQFVRITSNQTEQHMFFCSWTCLRGVNNEEIEYAKRWKKVKRLAAVLIENDIGFAWYIKNLFEFIRQNPKNT